MNETYYMLLGKQNESGLENSHNVKHCSYMKYLVSHCLQTPTVVTVYLINTINTKISIKKSIMESMRMRLD